MCVNVFVVCPECAGRGEVEYEVAVHASNGNSYGYLREELGVCDLCGGRGEVEGDAEDADDE